MKAEDERYAELCRLIEELGISPKILSDKIMRTLEPMNVNDLTEDEIALVWTATESMGTQAIALLSVGKDNERTKIILKVIEMTWGLVQQRVDEFLAVPKTGSSKIH